MRHVYASAVREAAMGASRTARPWKWHACYSGRHRGRTPTNHHRQNYEDAVSAKISPRAVQSSPLPVEYTLNPL